MINRTNKLPIPFNPQKYADEKVFVGRKELVSRLSEGCQQGYSFGVVGEPGIGKTSLLYAVKRSIIHSTESNSSIVSFPVYLEFDKIQLVNSDDFLEAILRLFRSEIRYQTGLSYSSTSVQQLRLEIQQMGFERRFRSVLDWYYSESRRSCRLVLLLDDLHRGRDSTWLNKPLSILRPIVAGGEIVIIMSGELPLEKEFRDDVSPLRNLVGEQITLGPLQQIETSRLVKIAQDWEWEVEAGCEDLVHELTRGHPYRIHYYLLQALRQYGKIHRSIVAEIHNNPSSKNYLDRVLKAVEVEKNIGGVIDNLVGSNPNIGHIMAKPVRILFLASNPLDTTQLNLASEARAIDQAIRHSEFRDKVEIQQQWAVRVSDLQDHLLRYEPDIVHFSGHGSNTSEIILEDEHGDRKTVPHDALRKLFAVLKNNIRCVVLNACYSASQAQAIAQHIDCVVGMSDTIGDEAAIRFAAAFYQALGYGKDIRTAFDLGCLQINLENLGEEDTPKLIATRIDPQKVVLVPIQ